MKYYGLHWIAADDTPLQIRIETSTQRVWARFCPKNGEWTQWRRWDVDRDSKNVLLETSKNSINANLADKAKCLAQNVTIALSGAVNGSAQFNGAENITINTTAGNLSEALRDLRSSLKSLALKVASLEEGFRDIATFNNSLNELRQKLAMLEQSVNSLGGLGGSLDELAQKLASLEETANSISQFSENLDRLDRRQEKIVQEIRNLWEMVTGEDNYWDPGQ